MNKQTENSLDFLDQEPEKKIEFYAAGVQFREGWRENLKALKEEDELFLVPEPTNKFDDCAVKIVSKAEVFLGYVPAKTRKNIWVLDRLFEGKQLFATVLSSLPESKPYQALLVEVKIKEV